MAHQSAVDAEGYARQAGLVDANGVLVPRLSPAPVQPANSPGIAAAPSLPNTTIVPDAPSVNASSGVAATRAAPSLPNTTVDPDSAWPRFAPLTRRPLQPSVSPWS